MRCSPRHTMRLSSMPCKDRPPGRSGMRSHRTTRRDKMCVSLPQRGRGTTSEAVVDEESRQVQHKRRSPHPSADKRLPPSPLGKACTLATRRGQTPLEKACALGVAEGIPRWGRLSCAARSRCPTNPNLALRAIRESPLLHCNI